MRSLQTVLSFVNESGVLLTGLIMLGYFGWRGMLGWLPLFVGIVVIIGSFVLAYLLANSNGDEYSEGGVNWDKFILYSLLFLSGAAAFATIGILI